MIEARTSRSGSTPVGVSAQRVLGFAGQGMMAWPSPYGSYGEQAREVAEPDVRPNGDPSALTLWGSQDESVGRR